MYNHQSLSLTRLVSAPLAENQIGQFVAFSFIKPDLLVGYQCCFVFRLADVALAKGQFNHLAACTTSLANIYSVVGHYKKATIIIAQFSRSIRVYFQNVIVESH